MTTAYTFDDWQTTTPAIQFTTTGPENIDTPAGVWVNNGATGFSQRTFFIVDNESPTFTESLGAFTLQHNADNHVQLEYTSKNSTCSGIVAPTVPVDATIGSAVAMQVPVIMTSGIEYSVTLELSDGTNAHTITQTHTGIGGIVPFDHNFLLSDFVANSVVTSALLYIRIRWTRVGTSSTVAAGTVNAMRGVDVSNNQSYVFDNFSTAPESRRGRSTLCGIQPNISGGWIGSTIDQFAIRRYQYYVEDANKASAGAIGSGSVPFNLQWTDQAYFSIQYSAGGDATTFLDATMNGADRFVLPITIPSGVKYQLEMYVEDSAFEESGILVDYTGTGSEQRNELAFADFDGDADFTQVSSLIFYVVRNDEGDGGVGSIGAFVGADPHVLCVDGTRIDVYEPGFYRMLDRATFARDVICNIQVDRTPAGEDYTRRAWLSSTETNGRGSVVVAFGADRSATPIVESGSSDALISVGSGIWAVRASPNVDILFEPKYFGIGISIQSPQTHTVFTAGDCLAVGRVRRVSSLTDDSVGPKRAVGINRFSKNALLCGSMNPHVVTLYGTRLDFPKAGCYCFLGARGGEWGINVDVDKRGCIRAVRVWDVNGGASENRWKDEEEEEEEEEEWIRETTLNSGCIMVRIQKGRVLSLAVHQMDTEWIGAAMGDIQPLETLLETAASNNDNIICRTTTMHIKPHENASMYERMLEPYLYSTTQ